MTVAQRFLLVIAIVLAILFGLAALGYFTGNWNEDDALRPGYGLASAESRPEFCVSDEAARERIRAIMVDALDDALHDQIKLLFEVWMKDDRGQPERAKVGVRQAIKAHQGARKAALEWEPPLCAGG